MVLTFQAFLLILIAVTLFSVIARWLPIPSPITLVLGGLAMAFVPGFENLQLDPELFFLLFLPPLLFADGWLMPLRELFRVGRTVLWLAFGLVLFTIATVGGVAHALVPGLPLAMAIALGAVVSPTDAVAVSAVTSRLKIPERLSAILNGESLLNDASGLVAFRFALIAMLAGTFSWASATTTFLYLALGGLGVGLILAVIVGLLRDGLRRFHAADALSETTLSLMTPFACYFVATAFEVSTVLAVVAAGLYSGWRDPIRMDVETRQTAWHVWEIFLYWLNGAAFLLLGLTAPGVLAGVADTWSLGALIGYPLLLFAVLLVGRALFIVPAVLNPRGHSEGDRAHRRKVAIVAVWSGMRGAVTLAAALSIPLTLDNGLPVPGRDAVIYLALGVVALTLVVHGVTLAPLIRWLGLEADHSLEEEERLGRLAAVEAGLKALESIDLRSLSLKERHALEGLVQEYEARKTLLIAQSEEVHEVKSGVAAARRFSLIALRAERAAVDRLWRKGAINDTVYRPLQVVLDHEEAMLVRRVDSSA